MGYCEHDVNHQSITDHCQDYNNDGKDCDSDLNVARTWNPSGGACVELLVMLAGVEYPVGRFG